MLLLVNVDDISGELIPHLIEELMARGAGNVHVIQSLTKKGRLEYLFFIDAPPDAVGDLGDYLAAEIGTLGIRVLETRHIHFDYRITHVQLKAPTAGGEVSVEATTRVKQVLDSGGQVVSVKAEYEDLRLAAAQFQQAGIPVSLTALKRLAEQVTLAQENRSYQNIQAKYLKD